MKEWGKFFLLLAQFVQMALLKIKNVSIQKEHEALEKNPGMYLHDDFSGGVHDDDANEAAKAKLKERLRSD